MVEIIISTDTKDYSQTPQKIKTYIIFSPLKLSKRSIKLKLSESIELSDEEINELKDKAYIVEEVISAC